MSAPAVERPTETRAEKMIATARQRVEGWARFEMFLMSNPDIAERCSTSESFGDRLMVSVSRDAEPAERIAEYARTASQAGARIEQYDNSTYAGIKAHFGPVHLDVYAARELVCRPVVVGQIDDVRYELTVSLAGIVEVSA